MDYNEWSREYSENVDALQKTIDKLKIERDSCTNVTDRLELDEKIKRYRSILYEMVKIAALLKSRGRNLDDV